MANRTFLLATDEPYSGLRADADVAPGILAAASYMIPVFWYALFDESCLAQRTAAGADGGTVVYPVFQSTRPDALERLTAFQERSRSLFASVQPSLFSAYAAFLQSAPGRWFAVEPVELWMMHEAATAEAGFRTCLRAVQQAPEATAPGISAGADWQALLDQAGIRLKAAKPIEPVSLCGYAWEKPVPWMDSAPVPQAARPASSTSAPPARPVCPACKKPLLSRHSPLCSFCGAKVPAQLLFTPAEKKAIEAQERQAARELTQREAERLRRARERRDG